MMRVSFGRYCRRLLAAASVASVVAVGVPAMDGAMTASAQTKTATEKKKKGSSSGPQKTGTANRKKTSGNQKQTGTGNKVTQKQTTIRNKGTQTRKKATSSTKKQTGPKSSAEAKKLQEATQRDIRQTEEKLRLNEQEVKEGLANLSRLSSEIATGRSQVAGLQKKVAGLNGQITNLGNEITRNEGELKRMREEYLKAVKKMRLTKKNQSTLAFIFASDNFNQAMRRIRYMRQFSAWKERKSADIDHKIKQLGTEREKLAQAKDAQTVALGQLTRSQAQLEENHKQQQSLVATLRRNGDALQAHLSAKQKEANMLRETISSLIAQEQAKAEAEAERRAREKAEAERKAKAEAERIAREKAEAERKAAEERAAAERAAAEKAAAEKALAEKVAAEKAAAEKAAAEKAAADKAAERALKEKLAAEKALAEKTAAEKAAAEKEAKEKSEAYKKAQEEKEKADRKFAEAKAKADEKLRKEQEKQDRENFKKSQRTARKKGDRRLKNSVAVKSGSRKADPVAVTTPKTVEKTVQSAKSANANVNFASLRGRLPRPVDGSWRVTNPFGRHSMPEMPEIEYDNPGIDAEVSKGTSVKAVCGGKVSGVYKLAGYGNVVIVNHGDYYTVYGNLGSTNVSVGTQVTGGTALGTAGSDPDDPRRGSVHFEVWKGREKQNPSSWLR